MQLVKKKLSNGAQLLMAPQDGTGSVAIIILFSVGSRYEEDRLRGISHFLEHMVFKGTKKRPQALDLSQELDGIGAEFNAFTSKEYTGYYIKAPAKHLPLLFDILEDMLMHSKFSAAEIKREKGPIIEELHMRDDNPLYLIGDLTEEVVFKGTTLGEEIAGSPETVMRTTRADIVKYYNQHYHAGNMVVGVAGSFAVPTVERLARKHLSSFKARAKVPHENEIFTQNEPRFHFKDRKSAQLMTSLSFLAYPHRHPDADALSILGDILGGGMSARLFISVRERRGLVYSIHAGSESYHDAGIFTIDAGIDPKRMEEAIKAILGELAKIKRSGVTAKELAKSKEHIKGRTTLSLENSSTLSQWLAFREMFDGGAKTIEQRFADIDRVAVADIKRVARDIICKETLSLVVIGSPKNKERLQKLVQDFKL